MAITKVVYNEAEERRLQRGPIADDATDRGQQVAQGMRSRVRVRSGKLLGSIRVEPADVTGDEVAVDVPADAENNGFPYAMALEFALEYPFMIPALEEIE